VTIGLDVIARAAEHLPTFTAASAAFVIADGAVAGRWFPPLAESLGQAGLDAVLLTAPAGERAKTLQVFEAMVHQLATQQAHRHDPVLALGGGAVGDLAGFVASTYMRGVPFVQVPTTLTAQVDAAIGGKTAVNLPEGKNLVGTFHQPRAVLADIGALDTLPEREFISGLAEVAKYAVALVPELLEILEHDPAQTLARDMATLEELVARCVGAKARIVAVDERDTDRRLVLNYGHTLGHALERLDRFEGRSHGEAVAVGMMFAVRLSHHLGLCSEDLVARSARLLKSLALPTHTALPSATDVLAAMRMDKKYRDGMRFVLLEAVGRAAVVEEVPESAVRSVLEEMGAT
jgi:3-dehydroquinate synthase